MSRETQGLVEGWRGRRDAGQALDQVAEESGED
jgi:hypothetical protein